MNAGLRLLAPGVSIVVRNSAIHLPPTGDGSDRESFERLATLSLFARLVEGCELHIAPT